MQFLSYNYINKPRIHNIDELQKQLQVEFPKFDIDKNVFKNINELFNKIPDFMDKLFELIIPKISDLSNYSEVYHIIRGYFSSEEKNKIDSIFSTFKGDIKEISSEYIGSFIVRILIKNVDEEKLKQITNKLLANNDINFIKNEYDERVYLELIERKDKNANDKICEKICNNFVPLCKNKYASSVIEKLLENCNENYYDLMLIKCSKNLVELSKDEFGFNIVSFFIKNKKNKNIDIIYESLKSKVYNLSQNKFGIYVINDSINYGNHNQRNQIIKEINNNLISLTKNENGYFVVKKILKYLDKSTISNLKSILELEKNNKYAKYV